MKSLLQRKYQVILQADTIFAFGHLEKDCKTLRGGTGWCVQMALDMEKDVYVYDIESSTWFRAKENRFRVWLKPYLPMLAIRSVLIGSTHIGPITNNAIQRLFHRTFCDNLQDIEQRLKEFEL